MLKYVHFHLIDSKLSKNIIKLSVIDNSFLHQDHSIKTQQLAFRHKETWIRIVQEIQTIYNFYTAIIFHLISLCISLSLSLSAAPTVS